MATKSSRSSRKSQNGQFDKAAASTEQPTADTDRLALAKRLIDQSHSTTPPVPQRPAADNSALKGLISVLSGQPIPAAPAENWPTAAQLDEMVEAVRQKLLREVLSRTGARLIVAATKQQRAVRSNQSRQKTAASIRIEEAAKVQSLIAEHLSSEQATESIREQLQTALGQLRSGIQPVLESNDSALLDAIAPADFELLVLAEQAAIEDLLEKLPKGGKKRNTAHDHAVESYRKRKQNDLSLTIPKFCDWYNNKAPWKGKRDSITPTQLRNALRYRDTLRS